MTEQQKTEFMAWFNKIIANVKEAYSLYYANIEGLNEYAACLTTMKLQTQLNLDAFNYALEVLDPVITERRLEIDDETIERSFIYEDVKVITIITKE